MLQFILFTIILCPVVLTSTSTNPIITKWIKSTGYKGYNNQLSDVQKVQYSSSYVYITSTSIPGTYTVGQPSGWAEYFRVLLFKFLIFLLHDLNISI